MTTGEAPRDENKISLIDSDGKAAYRIIYPEKASPLLLEAANSLKLSLYQASGKKFDLSGDSAAAQDCEILIGSTNRGDSAVNIPLGTYDFIITVKGTKVIITGGSDYATAKALDETVSFLEGDQLLLEKDFRYIGNTETEPHIIAVTNQSTGAIDIYNITTGVFDESTLLHRLKVDANNPAGVKLRRHETWGDVIITCYGANTGAILSYPEGKPLWTTYSAADNLLLNRCRARLGGNRAVAPCVIGVRAYLGSVFRVDGDNVPLQVLLEVVGVEYIFGITLVSVLQPDGSAVLIIEVYKEVVRGLRATTALRRPCLGDDLGAVQRVVVRRTSICLTGSDAIHSEDSTRICFVYNSVMESSLRIFQITATSFYNVPTRYLLVRCL